MVEIARDPVSAALDARPLSRLQVAAIAVTVGLNALDGFDVLASSFAGPGIAREWGIDKAALGFVLSMELIGMSLGSILLGGVADRFGRRPTVLGCLVVMTIGMLAAMQAASVVELSIWRIFTGIGIGGMLAATNALAAEYANARRRNLCLAMMVIGYPIGGVFGGLVAAQLLAVFDWRAVFGFGAAATLAFIPLVAWLVPETPAFLLERRPTRALERLNAILARMGQAALAALPPLPAHQPKRSVMDIFGPAFRWNTITVTLAYFAHVISFYFILKWVPKITVDMGFLQSEAARVLVWANVGAVTGGALFGLLAQRFTLKRLTLAALLLSTVLIVYFGQTPHTLHQLALRAAIAQLFVEAGIVGFYAIFAQAFPTHIRATATGFAIGVGRGGAALAPVLAGGFFQAGVALPQVAIIMAVGSLVAAVALSQLKVNIRQ